MANRIILPGDDQPGRRPQFVTRKEWKDLLTFLAQRDHALAEAIDKQIERINQHEAVLGHHGLALPPDDAEPTP